ncbi:MAG: cytochrome P450 [Nonomuraea sp.]|nr:cytochrome P450 [Nonomuraea sp.]
MIYIFVVVLLSLPYWLPGVVTAARVRLFARINGPEGVPVPGDLVDVSRFLEVYGHPAARGRSQGAALSDLFWYWLSPGAEVHQEHLEPGPRHAEVARCTRRVLTLPTERARLLAVESLRAAPPPANRRLVRLRDLAMPVWAEFYHRLVFGTPCPPGVRDMIVAHADDVVTALKCCGLRHMDRRLRLTDYLESALDRVPHPLPAGLSRREQAFYLQGTFFNTGVVQSSEATAHVLMVAAAEGRGEPVGELVEETLRRFPLFGIAHRVTREDIELAPNSTIPAGSVLCFNYPEFHAKGGNIPFGVPTNRPCPAWHLAPATVQAVVRELLGTYTFTTWAAHTRSLPNRGPCLMTPHGQAARLRLPLLAYLRVRDRWEEVTRSITQLVLGTYMVRDARRLRLCERHFRPDEKGNPHDPPPRHDPPR